MEAIYITNSDEIFFKQAWNIYLESFPSIERRTIDEQKKLINKDNYKMLCYIENDIVLSIVFYWKISTYTFLEHFAVNSKIRGKSYGSKILERFIEDNENIVLEIEEINDEISKKRLKFYEKFNFVLNEHEHYQIPFRNGEEELKLLLMTYKRSLYEDEYKDFYKQLLKTLNPKIPRSD